MDGPAPPSPLPTRALLSLFCRRSLTSLSSRPPPCVEQSSHGASKSTSELGVTPRKESADRVVASASPTSWLVVSSSSSPPSNARTLSNHLVCASAKALYSRPEMSASTSKAGPCLSTPPQTVPPQSSPAKPCTLTASYSAVTSCSSRMKCPVPANTGSASAESSGSASAESLPSSSSVAETSGAAAVLSAGGDASSSGRVYPSHVKPWPHVEHGPPGCSVEGTPSAHSHGLKPESPCSSLQKCPSWPPHLLR